jgi:hypothetical protein
MAKLGRTGTCCREIFTIISSGKEADILAEFFARATTFSGKPGICMVFGGSVNLTNNVSRMVCSERMRRETYQLRTNIYGCG